MSGLTVLKDVTLASPAAQLDLSGLDLSGWYMVRLSFSVQAASGQWSRTMMRFNDDAARNYIWNVRTNDGAVANSTDTVNYTAGLEVSHGSGPDQGTNYWGTNHVELINPGVSNAYKSYNLWGGNMPINTHSYSLETIGGGYWQNTAPITKISLVSNEGPNWVVGSRAVLLGVIPVHTPTSVSPDGLRTGSDNFNRADSSSLGSQWASGVTAFGGEHQIVSGQVKHSASAGTSSNRYTGTGYHGNQYSQAQIVGVPDSGGWTGVTVREGNNTGNGYLLIAFNNGGTHQDMNLYRMDAGAYTQIGTWTSVFNAGDTIRLEVAGSTLTAYKNGSVLGTATDATYALGQPGIQSHTATGTDGAYLDNWQGGEL